MWTDKTRPAAMAALASGVLMATYLALRPYGDVRGEAAMAAAFATNRWVLAHVCGMFALATFAWWLQSVRRIVRSRLGDVAAAAGWFGLVLVLPYYGAETFGLHVLGRAALATDRSVLGLADEIREQPVAMVMFGAGLLVLAVAAAAAVWELSRVRAAARWSVWPLGVLMILFLPHFYLPPAGRMAYGVGYLLATLIFALAVRRPAVLRRREAPAERFS